MKSAIHCFVFALGLALEASCWGQAEDTDELSRALALVNSSRTSDRVKGFESLEKLSGRGVSVSVLPDFQTPRLRKNRSPRKNQNCPTIVSIESPG